MTRNDPHTKEMVPAEQSISNLGQILEYLGKIRVIGVEGKFDQTHRKCEMFISLYRGNKGIVLSEDAARQAAVDADNRNLLGCVRVLWPPNDHRIEFLSSERGPDGVSVVWGFRVRSLEFSFISQPHYSVVPVVEPRRERSIVIVRPEEKITGIAQLAGYLHTKNPWVLVAGDYRGIHYSVRTARLQVTPCDLLLDFGEGEIIRLPCPPVQAFRLRPSGFSIARLSFTFTLDPRRSSPPEMRLGEIKN
jgi:hypothetical protein